MRWIDDFKTFALRGNIMDLAVGVIIGGAFGKIVSSAVNDLIMPLVALVLPGGNWRNQGIVLRRGFRAGEEVVLKYGDFLGSALDFLIISAVLFFFMRRVVRSLAPQPEAAKLPVCPFCKEINREGASRCRACTSPIDAGS